MDHEEATRLMATERYLLHELTPEARDDFEEHLFGCQECAMDVRAGAALIQQAKVLLPEFESNQTAKAKTVPPEKRRLVWMPAFSLAAVAALLIIVAYQNLVTNPELKNQLARANMPQVMASVSLASTRDTNVAQITAKENSAVLVFLDIPAAQSYSSYAVELHDPAERLIWSLPVTAESAKDTVSIKIPPSPAGSGLYTLVLYGIDKNPEERTELRQYKFQLKYQN